MLTDALIRGTRAPLFDRNKLTIEVHKMIDVGDYFTRKGKDMSKDLNHASELVQAANDDLDKHITRLIETEKQLSEGAKRAASSVKNSAQKLNEGLARIESKLILSS